VFDIAPLLQQSEDHFGYKVIARALDRSADATRFLDTLFCALMASQAAIYAILLDKFHTYPAVGWELLLAGFIIAILGTALTVFVREAPDPQSFGGDFSDDPDGTRRRYVVDYIVKARLNERLRTIKASILGVTLLLTVLPLVIATASRAGAI
jgi:hypothetical protein